ncbi:MAG TPA: hypothetical protein VGO93_24540 [Candidatus Xenobia bacterium]|jgi:hypothetical protein
MIVEGKGLATYALHANHEGAGMWEVEAHHHEIVDRLETESELEEAGPDYDVVDACVNLSDGQERRQRHFHGRRRKLTMDEMIAALARGEVIDVVEQSEAPSIAAPAWPSSYKSWRHRGVRKGVARMLSRALSQSTLMTAAVLSNGLVRVLPTRGATGTRTRLRRRPTGRNRR